MKKRSPGPSTHWSYLFRSPHTRLEVVDPNPARHATGVLACHSRPRGMLPTAHRTRAFVSLRLLPAHTADKSLRLLSPHTRRSRVFVQAARELLLALSGTWRSCRAAQNSKVTKKNPWRRRMFREYFRRGRTMAATVQDAPGGAENTRCDSDNNVSGETLANFLYRGFQSVNGTRQKEAVRPDVEALQKCPCPPACASHWRPPSLPAMTHMRWEHGQSGHESTDCTLKCSNKDAERPGPFAISSNSVRYEPKHEKTTETLPSKHKSTT